MKRVSRAFVTTTLAALVVALMAIPSAAQEGSASVRVAHLSPDAPAVDVYLDGQQVLSGVTFKQASDALPVPAGSHDVAVRAAGSAADSAAVIEATLDLEAGTAYTIGAVGLLADIRAQVWVGAATPPGEGKAGVRAIHAAPEVGAVDVALTGGDVILSGLAFPNASEYLSLDPGTYNLDVRAAGGTDALLMTSATVEANKMYSIVAVGGGGQPAELIALVDAVGSDTPSVLDVATGEGGTAMSRSTSWAAVTIGLFLLAAIALLLRRRFAPIKR